ncbi:MAG: nuclear transport factor 2 family protein [Pseudomonadota bacterium]|nr:nuclear transport factor 2 family protein [Pseudomonadota bacterium]
MAEDSAAALVQLAVAYGEAWNSGDADAILRLHTDDSVFQLHDGSPPAIGSVAVGNALREFFEQWSDATFTRRSVFFGKENWAVEWTVTARSRRAGQSGAGGVTVSAEGVDIVTVRGGLVSAKHVYYDTAGVSKMLPAA